MTGTSHSESKSSRSFSRSPEEETLLAAALKYRGLTYQALQEQPEWLNDLAEKAWDFFSIALRSQRSYRCLSQSPMSFDEVLSIVTMHYLEKFDRLWASASPEYYMSSVVKQMNNKVLDAAVRPFLNTARNSSAAVSLELLDSFLHAPENTEDHVMLREEVRLCLSHSEKCSRFEMVSLIATKCLRIKTSALADKIIRYGFASVCRSVLVSAGMICELDSIHLLGSLRNLPLPDCSDCSGLSDQISKASLSCARKLRKEVLRSLGKEQVKEVFGRSIA